MIFEAVCWYHCFNSVIVMQKHSKAETSNSWKERLQALIGKEVILETCNLCWWDREYQLCNYWSHVSIPLLVKLRPLPVRYEKHWSYKFQSLIGKVATSRCEAVLLCKLKVFLIGKVTTILRKPPTIKGGYEVSIPNWLSCNLKSAAKMYTLSEEFLIHLLVKPHLYL